MTYKNVQITTFIGFLNRLKVQVYSALEDNNLDSNVRVSRKIETLYKYFNEVYENHPDKPFNISLEDVNIALENIQTFMDLLYNIGNPMEDQDVFKYTRYYSGLNATLNSLSDLLLTANE